ncbi:24828_t:CDS:1, partial [Gigaspora rosea]
FLPTLSLALKTIFPDASENLISNYKKHLSDVDEFDSVRIITPNRMWINQHGWDAYYAAIDVFATYGLTSRHRDKNSRCIYHFREIDDLFQVRDGIQNNNSAPNAFCIPPSLHPDYQNIPNAQLVPIGTAWILMKVGSLSSDFGKDEKFFDI